MLLGLSPDQFKVAKKIPLESNMTSYRIGILIKDATLRTLVLRKLDEGFPSLKADGTLRKIMMKYGLDEK
jgi:ABC-type amino acid transport substrate-binding protein